MYYHHHDIILIEMANWLQNRDHEAEVVKLRLNDNVCYNDDHIQRFPCE